MGGLSSVVSAICDVFKAMWKAIRKVLAIVLIIIAVILIVWAAIFCPPLGGMLFGFFLTSTMAYAIGILCLVGAFLIDAETSKKVVGKIGDAVSGAVESVGQVVGGTVGAATGGLLSGLFSSSGGMLLLVGVGAYFLLSSDGDEKEKKKRVSSKDDRLNYLTARTTVKRDSVKAANDPAPEVVSQSWGLRTGRFGSGNLAELEVE